MMCRPASRIVFLLLLVLFAGGVMHGDDTSLTVHSTPDDPILRGLEGTFTPSSELVVAQGTSGGGGATLRLDCYYQGVGRLAPYVTLVFQTPANGPLQPGVYENTVSPRLGSANAARPSLEIYHSTRGHNFGLAFGRFEVLKVTYDAGGQVAAFHASFSLRAEGATGGLSGEIRLHADSTAQPVNQSPGIYPGGLLRALPNTPTELPALASDDGLPAGSVLSVHWSAFAEQGIVLDNADKLRPLATFPHPGTYRLGLDVSDGEFTQHRELDVQVLEPGLETFVHIASAPGDPIFHGRDRLVKRLDDSIECSAGTSSTNISVDTDEGQRTFILTHLPLTPGSYRTGDSTPNGTIQANVLKNSGSDPGNMRGTIDLKQIVQDAGGKLTQLWLVMKLSPVAPLPGPPVPPLLVEVRYEVPEGSIAEQAPIVTAGDDQVLTRREPTLLHGNVLDDGPNVPTLQWSKVSGPGEVQFADPTARSTEATVSETGTYVLRLTADDGAHQVSDEVTIERSALESCVIVHGTAFQAHLPTFARVYAPQDALWVVTEPDSSSVSLDLQTGTGASLFRIVLSSGGSGRRLQAGTYNPPDYQSSDPYIEVDVPEVAYNQYSHRFTIREISFDEKGHLVTLSAELHNAASFYASVRLNSSGTDSTGPNRAPRVTVVGPHTIPSAEFRLEATLSDDGLPNEQPLEILWEQIDGPAAATFDDPHCLHPYVRVPKPGVYRFRVTASDGEFSTSAETAVAQKSVTRTYTGTTGVDGVVNGKFTMTVRPSGQFTARLIYRNSTIVLTGKFEGINYSKQFTNIHGDQVSIDFEQSLDGTYIGGSINIGSNSFGMGAEQNQSDWASVESRPSPWQGNYNLLLAPPYEMGFARLSVGKNDVVRLAGRLPDGTAISSGSRLTAREYAAFFIPLYGARGSLAGDVHFVSDPASGLSGATGSMSWIHPANPKDWRHPDPFVKKVPVVGYLYSPPARDTNSFSQEPAECDTFLTAQTYYTFKLGLRFDAGGAIIPAEHAPGFKISVARATGLFRGTFRATVLDRLSDNEKEERCSFFGLLTPAGRQGFGYFRSPNDGGFVRIDLATP
jgi:hypothetical protein